MILSFRSQDNRLNMVSDNPLKAILLREALTGRGMLKRGRY